MPVGSRSAAAIKKGVWRKNRIRGFLEQKTGLWFALYAKILGLNIFVEQSCEVGTQFPMYNLQTQIVGHDGWLDLETLNKENIGPHFQNLILLTSTQFKSLSFSDTEKYNSGNTEYVDGYDTALFLAEYLSRDSYESLELIETHSHLYYFPENARINRAVNILSYKNFRFQPLGYFLSDSLISYVSQTP